MHVSEAVFQNCGMVNGHLFPLCGINLKNCASQFQDMISHGKLELFALL